MPDVLNAQPSWNPPTSDRTVGGKINFGSGLSIPTNGMLLGQYLGDGKTWIKSEVDYNTSPQVGGSFRDEFQVFKLQSNGDLFVKNKYYAVDIHLPTFAYDNRNMAIAQWKHINTYLGTKLDYYPFVALNIRPQAGVLKFAIVRKWSDSYSYSAGDSEHSVIEWMDAVESDRTYRFVFEINWSNASDGYVKVYIDGSLAFTFNGPNIDPPPPSGSAPQPMFRCGHYQYAWGTTPSITNRKAYYSNARVGNADMNITDYTGTPPVTTNININRKKGRRMRNG
jgi:hypothetical protein